MTKKERAEKAIERHLRAIEKIYESIDPAGDYLDLFIGDTYLMFNNKYWEKAPAEKISVAVERFTDDDFDS